MPYTIFALLTEQGTAADETAICEHCRTPQREARIRRGAGCDVPKDGAFVECSGNDMLRCWWCGQRGVATEQRNAVESACVGAKGVLSLR